jgi:ankyrin repeat protein
MLAILVERCSPLIVEKLINAGADVNAINNGQRWTPLAFAARDGKADICKVLLDSGAQVDPVDIFGNTPLWRAAMTKKREVAQLLIARGANPDHANKRGVSPRTLMEQGA